MTCAVVPPGLAGSAPAASWDGTKLYFIGGVKHGYLAASGSGSSDVYIFDMVRNTWAKPQVAVVPGECLYGCTATPYASSEGNLLIIVGGSSDPALFLRTLHLPEDQTISWRVKELSTENSLTQLPPSRFHSATLIGNDIFVFGGLCAGHVHNKLLKFSIGTKVTCTLIEAENAPPARSHHTATAVGTSLFIFGGCSDTDVLTDTWTFDTVSRHWSCLDPSPPVCIPPTPLMPGWCPREEIKPSSYSCYLHSSNSIFTLQPLPVNDSLRFTSRLYNLTNYAWQSVTWQTDPPLGFGTSDFRLMASACNTSPTLLRLVVFGGVLTVKHSAPVLLNDLWIIGDSRESRATPPPSQPFSTKLLTPAPPAKPAKPTTTPTTSHTISTTRSITVSTDSTDLCKICYEKKIDTVVLECGHSFACMQCASSLRVCSVCRKDIVRVIKLYKM
ncbi:hypothetical protein Pelo_3285 [Pelomyxa schiedti]|nr:hypothetical protein Pelo_3285 [Pelomyxa schiedti]